MLFFNSKFIFFNINVNSYVHMFFLIKSFFIIFLTFSLYIALGVLVKNKFYTKFIPLKWQVFLNDKYWGIGSLRQESTLWFAVVSFILFFYLTWVHDNLFPFSIAFFPLCVVIVFNLFPTYNLEFMQRFSIVCASIFLIYTMSVFFVEFPINEFAFYNELNFIGKLEDLQFMKSSSFPIKYSLFYLDSYPQIFSFYSIFLYIYACIVDSNFLLNLKSVTYFSQFFPEYQYDTYYRSIENAFPFLSSFVDSYNLKFTFASSCLIILTAFITLICVLLPRNWSPSFFSMRAYINIIFIIEFFCIQFFLSANLLYFYIFFESVLIPMYLLIGIWGLRDRKIHASYQFFMYTFFGSLFMIVAIITLGYYLNSFNMFFCERYWWFFMETNLKELEILLWLFFFLGFAIKVPMVPFHIWLPEAHVEAPTGGSIILAAILLKFGTYGFYRVLIELLPWGSNYLNKLIVVLSLISIMYASVINFIQIDLKKIIAYSSVSHMGYVTLGLILDNPEGIVGALFMMITHGFISGALFYIVGILYERYGTRNLFYYGGLKNVMPYYTLFFFLLTLANMNLPLTAGFVSEFLVLIGTGALESKIIIFISAFGLITNGIYCIWLFNRLCFGNNINEGEMEYKDLNEQEMTILSMFVLLIVLLGVFPNGILLGLEQEVYNVLWNKNLYFL